MCIKTYRSCFAIRKHIRDERSTIYVNVKAISATFSSNITHCFEAGTYMDLRVALCMYLFLMYKTRCRHHLYIVYRETFPKRDVATLLDSS